MTGLKSFGKQKRLFHANLMHEKEEEIKVLQGRLQQMELD